MLNADQIEIVVNLVRKNARMVRGESLKILRLMNSLIWAQEAQVPEPYLLPFISSLRKVVEGARFDQSALPVEIGSLFNKNMRCSVENLEAMEKFATRIRSEFRAATGDAVLGGDGAALAALYQDPGAYRAAYWAAVLRDGTCANGDKPKCFGPLADEWSEKIEFGQALWRIPKPALMIALFAGHVGDPTNLPVPPMWHHLGLALLLWKDRISVKEVLDLGGKLSQLEEVERGLTIAAHIFPELADWIKSAKLSIPLWERKYAVPIAARRIAMGERE